MVLRFSFLSSKCSESILSVKTQRASVCVKCTLAPPCRMLLQQITGHLSDDR